MDGINIFWMVAVGVPVLLAHVISIALYKALQSYSRTLLEERCEARGRGERAMEVERSDHKTERAAEALSVLTGLLLAAQVGVWVGLASAPPRAWVVVLPVLAIGLLGYVISGVIGKVFAEIIVDVLWPAAGLMRTVATPLTFGLRRIERMVEWFAGRSTSIHRPASLQVEVPADDETADDDDEPEIPESARVLLQHAVGLTRKDVYELMTPRSSMISLPSTVAASQAAATFRTTGLSRIPLFGESRDDIVGVLYAKDLFARMTDARGSSRVVPAELARVAVFVPESKNAYELLEELRSQRRHFAIVLDEYGSVAGVVTLEDLLEELVGAIEDEHDMPAPADPVRELGGTRFEVDAALTLEELNERLGLQLPTDGEFQTVGGLVFHELGRLPVRGDSVHAFGVTFTVVEVGDNTIRRILLDLAPSISSIAL